MLELSADVLVIGGGLAGAWAAIGAAREGAEVVLVENGADVVPLGCGYDVSRNAYFFPSATLNIVPQP